MCVSQEVEVDLGKVDPLTLRQVLLLLERAVKGAGEAEMAGGGDGDGGGDGAGAGSGVAEELDCHVDTMSKLVNRRRIKAKGKRKQ